MKRNKLALLCLSALLGLNACSDSSDYDFDAAQEEAESEYASNATLAPIFDPANGKIPSTNDLLFAGSTDGTLNIPTANASPAEKPLYDVINTLDGFGLTSPFTAGFGNTIDPESVGIGSSVHVFEVTKDPATSAVTGVVSELGAADMLATVNSSADTLVFLPLRPLKESTSYMVVLTNSLKGANGKAAASPSAYLLAKASQPLSGQYAALEPLRQLIGTQEAAAVTQGIPKNRVILSWTFTTQSVSPVLQAVTAKAEAATKNMVVSPAIGTTATFVPGLQGKANVHVGTVDLPYYLSETAPLSDFWHGVGGSLLSRFNPSPVATTTQTVPVIMTTPGENSAAGATPPDAGWPVVIFQHGVTRSRQDVLAVADALADAGFAAVAIDLPLHGVSDATSPLKAENNLLFAGDAERTLNLDVMNNTTSAPGADGEIDSSGSHFINLTSLLTSRDNIRQGISDLLVLRQSLADVNLLPSGKLTLDTSRVGFVGHSLGAMVGTGYLSQEATSTTASLVVPGGGIARLLDASETFGPSIHAGLAAVGLEQGTAAYDTFMAVTQMVTDPADPVVLGAQAAAKHPIHMIEVVGINGVGSDNVIPNRVAAAPLSGTEPLIRVMGLKSITQTTPGSDGVVRFSEGVHGSILDPAASLAATVEMQSEVAAFQAQNGVAIAVFNPAVISVE